MSPIAYFVMMDLVSHRFHIYHGDVNNPATWTYQGHSFDVASEADDKAMDLNEQ